MDHSRIDRRAFLATGAAGIAGLAGCLGNSSAPWDEGERGDGWTVNVGVLVPQSGALEAFAEEIEDGVRLVERQFESITDPDYSLDVTVRDSGTDPGTAVDAGQELVDEGNQIIVGPGTSESLAALTEEVLVPESALACSPLASANLTAIDNPGRFFITAPRTRTLVRALERPIALNQVQSVGIVHSPSPYGVNIADGIVEGLRDRGIDVHANESIEDDESPGAVLDTVTADDPDGLIVACDPSSGIPLLEAYYTEFEPGYTFLPDRLRFRDLPERFGVDMADATVVSHKPGWEQVGLRETVDPDEIEEEVEIDDDDRLDWFDEAFEAEYDRHPSIQAAQAFDATVVMVLGAIAAGEENYDGDVIAERIPEVVNPQSQYEGVRGFSSNDYWEGIGEIADGIRNNYTGASGGFVFDSNTGLRGQATLHAVRFAPETASGFEETLPIHT